VFLFIDTDRSWDEKGSAAYKKHASITASNNTKQQETETKDSTSASAPLVSPPKEPLPQVPLEELQAAFPFPWAFLVGWTLLGTSYFCPLDGTSKPWIGSGAAMGAAAVCLALAWIASVPMGDAVMTRNGTRKLRLSMLFVSSWVVLVVVSGLAMPTSDMETVQTACRAVGAVMIIASMKVLWKFRKMGDTWEQEGKPNPNPVVYNMGGPLFVFGWFLFWVGMAATATATLVAEGMEDPFDKGIPIYFTARTALAVFSGCGMVPVVMGLDYAHDEGAEFTGFGTDGRFFGRFLESPLPFLFTWTLFGLCAWLPFPSSVGEITALQWIILVNCVAQGVDAGLLIQTALYKGDMAGKMRWSIPFVLMFVTLAVEIGYLTPGSSRRFWMLSLPGAFLIVLGQKTVFGDRKRGDYWMETKQVNPNPIVYSYGEPFFMTGWILLTLAMSIPL
jgi:hypothetical protein